MAGAQRQANEPRVGGMPFGLRAAACILLAGLAMLPGCSEPPRQPPKGPRPQQVQRPTLGVPAPAPPPRGPSDSPSPGEPGGAEERTQLPLALERLVRPCPAPTDLDGDAELHWVSEIGPGGMLVPQLLDPEPEPEEGLTHVQAAVFPEGSPEVIFVGRREPDWEPISHGDLLDAFVLAYEALGAGSPPGVSIDPRSQQLQAGLREGDAMDVVYFGGVEQSEYGFAAFEADRLMKCLSGGKDNLTGKPFSCAVPGYRSELELHAANPASAAAAWHRFWIEYDHSDIGHSPDGRAYLAAAKLAVHTEYMEVRNGKLVSGNRQPDPAARQFAAHLTENYAAYARVFPVFNRLAAFAAVTSIAAAIREDDGNPVRRLLERDWPLEEHRPAPRATPGATPAVVATHGRAQLTGGVKLQPENRHHRPHARTEQLQRDVLQSLPHHAGQRQWTVVSQGVEYQAVRAKPRRARRTWQQDLQVGSLRLVREFGPRYAQGNATPGWFFRVPRVRLADETVAYQSAGRGPKAAYVYDETGQATTLSQFGKLTMPGNAATPGYAAADDSARLYLYANAWMYLEGEVEFVSLNGGPPTMQLGSNARVIQFSPHEADNHRVESVWSAEEKTLFEYEGGRLARIRNARGDAIRFPYDSSGRCAGAIGSDGQSVSYHYDERHRLKYLANRRGATLSYLYSEATDAPLGVRGRLTQNPAAAFQPTVQALLQTPQPLPSRTALVDPATRFVSIEPLADETGGYDVRVDGQAFVAPGQWRVPANFSSETIEALVREMSASPAFSGADALVVTGDWDLSNRLASALRKTGVRAFSATSPQLAEQNLHGAASSDGRTRLVIHRKGLFRTVLDQLPADDAPAASTSSDAGTVIIVGHNSPSFIEQIRQLGEEGALRNRDVVLLTCFSCDTPGLVENALRSYGAVSVTGFSQPIAQPLLPSLLRRLQDKLARQQGAISSDAMRKSQSLESLLQEAVDELHQERQQNKFPASIDAQEIDKLRLLYERLGRRFLGPRQERLLPRERGVAASLAA